MRFFKRKQIEPATRKARLWAHFKSLASTAAFVWLFTSGVAQATLVPSESMSPTILVGDHFFLDKVAFPGNYPERLQTLLPERTVNRGDIVAFWSPETPDLRLIKRVVAVGGDKFEIREGHVYINDARVNETYAVFENPQGPSGRFSPITIPPDSFFM